MAGSTTGINTGPPGAGTSRPPQSYEMVIQSVDPEGKIGVTRITINFLSVIGGTSTTLDTIGQLLAFVAIYFQQCTYCQVLSVALNYRLYVAATKPKRIPGAAQNIEDKAYIELITDHGGPVTFQVPAPVSSLFLADGETIDPTSTYMQEFLAGLFGGITYAQSPTAGAVVGLVATDPTGDALLSYVKGYRRRARTRRRLRQGISTEIGG